MHKFRVGAVIAEIIALACATTVFVAAALEPPVDSPATPTISAPR